MIQVGFADELEKEIVHINSILNREIAKESIQIAENFDLAYTQLKIVNKLENFGWMFQPISTTQQVLETKRWFQIRKRITPRFMHQNLCLI